MAHVSNGITKLERPLVLGGKQNLKKKTISSFCIVNKEQRTRECKDNETIQLIRVCTLSSIDLYRPSIRGSQAKESKGARYTLYGGIDI